MKPNKWMFLSIFAVAVICAVKVYAANQTLSMTTYFPAPTGYYDSVKVTKSLVLPCYPLGGHTTNLSSGQIWIEDASCP